MNNEPVANIFMHKSVTAKVDSQKRECLECDANFHVEKVASQLHATSLRINFSCAREFLKLIHF